MVVFSSTRPAGGLGGAPTGLRPSPDTLGTTLRAGMQLSHVAQQLAGRHHRPAPTDRKAVRRGPVAGRFSKPACPPPWVGSAGFAPNELFCRLSLTLLARGKKLIGSPTRRAWPGADAPTSPAPGRLSQSSWLASGPDAAAPPLKPFGTSASGPHYSNVPLRRF